MKYQDVNICLRCQDPGLIKDYPLAHCQKCKALIIAETNRRDHRDEIKVIKFTTSLCHVSIMCWENETYINGENFINCALPPNISEDKLKTYITFS